MSVIPEISMLIFTVLVSNKTTNNKRIEQRYSLFEVIYVIPYTFTYHYISANCVIEQKLLFII